MKTKSIFAVAASALMLASCANEDLVSPNATGLDDANVAMGFGFKVGNMTRDNELNNVYKDFGVWSIKADNQGGVADVASTPINETTKHANLVMRNYLVGYVGTGTDEYNVPDTQEKFQSNWVYENLGNSQGISNNSNESSQYLKYWDFSKKNTYFFAYAPYIKGAYTPDFNPKYATNKAALTFKEAFNMTTGVAADNEVPMYVGKRELNSTHQQTVHKDAEIGTNTNENKVDLEFKHLLAQLKIAVIEKVPGYKVKLTNVEFSNADRNGATATIDANSYDNATNKLGIVAYPAKPEGASYVEGNILKSAKPVVVFDIPEGDGTQVLPSTVNYDTTDTDNAVNAHYFRFALPTNAQDGTGTKDLYQNEYLYEDRANRAFSGTVYTVIPNNYDTNNANSGLQFIFNFDLVAEDTGEVIHVKNARAFVGPEYTNWAANTIYTYTFRIEKGTTGTTEGINPPERPDNPGKALYPIVFDSITVANWDESAEKPGANPGQEFVVNQE